LPTGEHDDKCGVDRGVFKEKIIHPLARQGGPGKGTCCLAKRNCVENVSGDPGGKVRDAELKPPLFV